MHDTTAAIRVLPAELDAILDGVSDDDARRRPAPDAWSALEILCHLRDAAQIEHERITRIASEDNPEIAAWDNEARAVEYRYSEQRFDVVRADLIAAWAALADLLESLPDDAWPRTAHHSERGTITLAWRAQRQYEHPREHFEQIRVVLRTP